MKHLMRNDKIVLSILLIIGLTGAVTLFINNIHIVFVYIGIAFLLSTIWIWYKKFTYKQYVIAIQFNLNVTTNKQQIIVSLLGGKDLSDRIVFMVKSFNFIINQHNTLEVLAKHNYSFNADGCYLQNDSIYLAPNYKDAYVTYLRVKNIFNIINANLGDIVTSTIQNEQNKKSKTLFSNR